MYIECHKVNATSIYLSDNFCLKIVNVLEKTIFETVVYSAVFGCCSLADYFSLKCYYNTVYNILVIITNKICQNSDT